MRDNNTEFWCATIASLLLAILVETCEGNDKTVRGFQRIENAIMVSD